METFTNEKLDIKDYLILKTADDAFLIKYFNILLQ
jgi:hypothetical protein